MSFTPTNIWMIELTLFFSLYMSFKVIFSCWIKKFSSSYMCDSSHLLWICSTNIQQPKNVQMIFALRVLQLFYHLISFWGNVLLQKCIILSNLVWYSESNSMIKCLHKQVSPLPLCIWFSSAYFSSEIAVKQTHNNWAQVECQRQGWKDRGNGH